jgi:hypothetical protein
VKLSQAEIERLMGEDPDDRDIREAHGFEWHDDWQDESLLCRFGCGLSYPDVASGKIRECRPHGEFMRKGALKVLAEYDNPPEGGTLVPRVWVEEHRAGLEVMAEAERRILGDLENFKPTGLLNVLGIEPA